MLLIFMLAGCAGTHQDLSRDVAQMETSLQALVDPFHGDVGIYAKNLKSGQEIAINADVLFPTASMIKVPILLTLFQKIQNGDIDYDSTFIWSADLVNYSDDGILSSFKDSSSISLTKIISLMITYSDNLASLWCQQLSGGGLEINRWLDANGFSQTRMNSRTPDRQDDWESYGWGQTTPREMAGLLTLIHENKAVSPWASEEMYRYLTRIYWDDEALSAIPRTIQAASKQGAVDASRSEVVLVNAPRGDYVFCVITKNQEDESWAEDNAGFVLLREVSQILWESWGREAPKH
ncbi:MAG: class A beta-lactamase-related serine hydrolase [Candidatus Marinimicrobia bacterium]|nr:class A beta-lactamase-related serine hydrolase [Candidatus Neomarinimicrobiota bacterium]MCF7921439.1 class A beta-lactamase-related serine hydrolase [Candidatus Neomarinimicrobiota bacterium]